MPENIDFYDQIILLKKHLKKTNADIGAVIGMTGDAFRMALSRKSLSNLQLREIEQKFVSEISRQGIDDSDKERANTIKVADPFEQFAKESKNGHTTYNMPDGSFMMKAPLIPVKAHARYISEGDSAEFLDNNLEYAYFMVDHVGMGKYRAFQIKGDSFWNEGGYDTPDKAIALARELDRSQWRDGFRDSEYGWIIVTTENIVLKDIIDQDMEKGIIICHSRNPSKEYSDFPLSLDQEVKSVWKVIKRQF